MKNRLRFKIQDYKLKLKKGDLVVVTVGKDRGKQSKIERVFPKKAMVLLPGLNQYKKHRKPQGENRPGEILTLSRPMAISKVALICPKCKQQTRIGQKTVNDKKVRFCKKCEQNI